MGEANDGPSATKERKHRAGPATRPAGAPNGPAGARPGPHAGKRPPIYPSMSFLSSLPAGPARARGRAPAQAGWFQNTRPPRRAPRPRGAARKGAPPWRGGQNRRLRMGKANRAAPPEGGGGTRRGAAGDPPTPRSAWARRPEGAAQPTPEKQRGPRQIPGEPGGADSGRGRSPIKPSNRCADAARVCEAATRRNNAALRGGR